MPLEPFGAILAAKPWEETKEVACAFKPNAAFFEVYGSAGWEALQRTLQLIPPDIPWLGAVHEAKSSMGSLAGFSVQKL